MVRSRFSHNKDKAETPTMEASTRPQHTSNQAIEIVVYTKSDNSESRHVKRVLRENGYNFVEQDGGRADVVLGLQKRLGHFVEIPGLLVDGKEWISESPDQSWTDGLDKYCLSKLLNSTTTNPQASSSSSSSDEVAFRPLAEPQHDSPHERRVPLPNGTTKTVVQLTNELIHHHRYDGIIFEGDRAIDVYKLHYGATNDDQAVRFGYILVGCGILVIVASDAAGFGDSQVRLFATQEGLNTAVAWPGRKIDRLGEALRLLQSILRTISKVDQPGDPQRRLKLLRQIDFDVCALQACSLHKASALFLLQLFNVLMRHYGATHAMPTTLPEILELQTKIGYRIDGRFVTAADLRTWLLVGSSKANIPPVKTIGKKKRHMIRMLRCEKVTEDEEEMPLQHSFTASFIETDHRLVFAMAWTAGMGTLEASLDQIVSVYCQTNIAIHNNTVFLPPLLQWFQNDFGKTPEVIVKRLQQHLPIGHRLRIQSLYEEGNLRVKFRSHHVSRFSNPVDLDEERTFGDQSSCRLSCYLDSATVSENNTMGPTSMSAMSIFSAGLQSRPNSGRIGSSSLIKSTSVVSMGAEMGKVPESPSDGDTTRSTTEESASTTEDQNRDDYGSWFKSDMSMITYGSDFDVMVNEAYFNGGEAESQRDISFIS